ncbi:ph domain protein [Cystoisospora suis]|uniref:Ph domain protein n=1 Tax=Cystoisospora suis TaxID=483139 RepID=A0A2C6L661_9APIC|nr:ph domain protein [Cystoisospora suis]
MSEKSINMASSSPPAIAASDEAAGRQEANPSSILVDACPDRSSGTTSVEGGFSSPSAVDEKADKRPPTFQPSPSKADPVVSPPGPPTPGEDSSPGDHGQIVLEKNSSFHSSSGGSCVSTSASLLESRDAPSAASGCAPPYALSSSSSSSLISSPLHLKETVTTPSTPPSHDSSNTPGDADDVISPSSESKQDVGKQVAHREEQKGEAVSVFSPVPTPTSALSSSLGPNDTPSVKLSSAAGSSDSPVRDTSCLGGNLSPTNSAYSVSGVSSPLDGDVSASNNTSDPSSFTPSTGLQPTRARLSAGRVRDARSRSHAMALPRWTEASPSPTGSRVSGSASSVSSHSRTRAGGEGFRVICPSPQRKEKPTWERRYTCTSSAGGSSDEEDEETDEGSVENDEEEGERGRKRGHRSGLVQFCGEEADNDSVELMGDEDEKNSPATPRSDGAISGDVSARDDELKEERAISPSRLSPQDALFEDGAHPRRKSASDDSIAALQGFKFLYTSALSKDGIACCGFLKKRSPNRLVGWQRRWFVLKDKRLMYYRSPEDQTPAGRIDLELVKIKIQCLWDPRQFHGGLLGRSGSLIETAPADFVRKGAWMDLICCGTGARASDFVKIAGNDLQREVRFRLCPVGCRRVFELAGPYVEVVEWIDKLRTLVKTCRVSQDQVHLVAQQADFWKVERISPAKFESIVDTGDVVLFRTMKFNAQLQRAVTRGHYDHVGMVLRSKENGIFILESLGDTGVIMTPWRSFVDAKWYTSYRKVVLRRLRWNKSHERLDRLLAFLKNVIGRSYELTFSKLFVSGMSADKPDKGFFCSELVASALKMAGLMACSYSLSVVCHNQEIGALPEDALCTRYWPQSFAASSNLNLCDGFELDEELLVDFCLQQKRKKRRHKHKKPQGRTVPLPQPALPIRQEKALADAARLPALTNNAVEDSSKETPLTEELTIASSPSQPALPAEEEKALADVPEQSVDESGLNKDPDVSSPSQPSHPAGEEKALTDVAEQRAEESVANKDDPSVTTSQPVLPVKDEKAVAGAERPLTSTEAVAGESSATATPGPPERIA